jgi:hypothetical protein
MFGKQIQLDTEEVSRAITHFLIGFGRLSADGNIENAECAGSGTLVTVGSVHGVLTAAHVLTALPRTGKVAIVTRAIDAGYKRQTINMEHVECVLMPGKESNDTGPDLGFLRLPDEVVGWLKAQNSFYSLTKRRQDALDSRASAPLYADWITGMIHELTAQVPSGKPGVRRIRFMGIFWPTLLIALRYFGNYDLRYLEVKNEPGFPLPKSFEGTSGGAVWRIYVAKKERNTTVIDKRLIGVPFYQLDTAIGKKEITCAGPQGIYGPLIEAIEERCGETVND